MNIGVVGMGVVGTAISDGFKQIGHKVKSYDIKDSSQIESLLDCNIIYICVPTNPTATGSCDTSQVVSTVEKLNILEYQGIVAIKSTVLPGTTQELHNTFPDLQLCFVPEFLRERSALSDFMDLHDILIVGTDSPAVFGSVVECHNNIPKKTIMVSATEAEIAKYFNNVYNAMRITFANGMFEVCDKLGADYQSVFSAISSRNTIGTDYLRCSEFLRGYQGACLPKDTQAFAVFVKSLGLDLALFDSIVRDNQHHLEIKKP
jgi:UDPglucose 6-dehydrogenase